MNKLMPTLLLLALALISCPATADAASYYQRFVSTISGAPTTGTADPVDAKLASSELLTAEKRCQEIGRNGGIVVTLSGGATLPTSGPLHEYIMEIGGTIETIQSLNEIMVSVFEKSSKAYIDSLSLATNIVQVFGVVLSFDPLVEQQVKVAALLSYSDKEKERIEAATSAFTKARHDAIRRLSNP